MLTRLTIHNYAIIDLIEAEFFSGFNVITGETGAGKSILIGALSLVLGERADTAVLLNKEKRCLIEGTFISKSKPVKQFLYENEFADEEEIIMRREIAPNGKSRAFINDTPANLNQMRRLASMLVDLHQQFDTLELNDAAFQQEALDALADNQLLIQQYQKQFTEWKQSTRKLDELLIRKSAFQKEKDYNQFLSNELREANFQNNELEDLDNELKMLTYAEDIKTAITAAVYELSESETPVVQTLKSLNGKLNSFSSINNEIKSVGERLHSTQIELQDIADELENINNRVSFDEQRINSINERISLGYRLLKKHGFQTTEQLLALNNELNKKLQSALNIEEEIEILQQQTRAQEQQLKSLAQQLSARRIKAIKPFEDDTNRLLFKVGMPNARLKVSVLSSSLHSTGADNIEYLFNGNLPAGSINGNARFEPLYKIASGGELSRLMLCIKSLVAEKIDLPVLIFDEIDTGISGEAAKQVGIIMQQLAAKRQLITITHQPQIAGKAGRHFFVYKNVAANNITTGIKTLTKQERVQAIAQMLGGDKPTSAALQNAREMIESA